MGRTEDGARDGHLAADRLPPDSWARRCCPGCWTGAGTHRAVPGAAPAPGDRGRPDLRAGRDAPHRRPVELVTGDITAPDLGLTATTRAALDDATGCGTWPPSRPGGPPEVAHRVNVDGTAHVLDLCQALPRLKRLQYVSTCYVSGRYDGEFGEDVLDQGSLPQPLRVDQSSSPSSWSRDAMADGLPADDLPTGHRRGRLGDGETQKFDGPYFIAGFLKRQPGPVAVVPGSETRRGPRSAWSPRDFVVDAMDALSVQDRSVGRTLRPHRPPPRPRGRSSPRSRHAWASASWVPAPSARPTLIDRVPGMERLLGLPAEAVDTSPRRRRTPPATNTTTDLEGTGVSCPLFEGYADRLVDFMREHAEITSKAMV